MKDQQAGSDRYVVISSGCHAGVDLRDYKPYLEKRWHDEFDACATAYFDPWATIDTESEYTAGVSSFMSPLNWDSAERLEELETDGVVAEVIFPNTTPLFFPNGLPAATLYGADMDLLQMVADRVGPSVDEVNEPLRSDEIPEDPNFGFIIETYLGMSDIVGPKMG